MALSSMIPLLKAAQKEGYAVGQFNFHNMDGLMGILQAAGNKHSPLILGPLFLPPRAIMAMLRELANEAAVPVAVTLDHGRSLDQCQQCIDAGYTDVMLDSSALPFEENVRGTRAVVEAAHKAGVGVEGEIGHVGMGEDYGDISGVKATLTKPEEAARYVEETGVDAVAVAIGSAHGHYKGEPHLYFERLSEIRMALETPLVLHGGSGISDSDFRESIRRGISKVNIYTHLADAALAATRAQLADPDLKHFFQLQYATQDAIRSVVEHYMDVFGSTGRAS
ncbi:MAG: class II fructose-bisphosphate aldolase [Candidatus Abyssobacteria bacterium SURF_5]|uniref:Class II fructose-bisphosphate aldolase n=1 Tax=Abyssobacteria bacterium (strain SURF_5) TaxID=2093360 RepID=A0A3A4P6E1_ABYX5|nr:MAG: class II fructose-bisphosphate aldolase [Candidatus Abyssubacteria bacterium SURF_5]